MAKIFGHRGSAGTSPENTMVSFEEAKKSGADGVELDVQMTKDGKLIIIHDETVERTTNGKGWIKDLTLKEIKQLDAGSPFSVRFKGERIPTLDEMLDWATSNSLKLNIEIKNNLIDYPRIEEHVIQKVRSYHLEERVILSSFNHYSVALCHELAPEIETAVLFMDGLYTPWKYAREIGAKGIHPYWRVVRKDLITQSKAAMTAIRTFTVNDEARMKQFILDGIDSVITDFPKKAVKLRNSLL